MCGQDGPPAHSREALRRAIISALPVDWDDYTTRVQFIAADDNGGYPVAVWGRPQRLADAIIAALHPYLTLGPDTPANAEDA